MHEGIRGGSIVGRMAALPIALGLILVLAGCGSGTNAPVGAGAAVDSRHAGAAPAADGSSAPAFELEAIDGASVSLADSAGDVRLIDFWATWCAPCREEIPMLNALHERYGGRGLTIIAIADEDPTLVREFVERNDVSYMNLIDRGGEVTGRYLVPGLPTAFLVDGDGQVVERFFGPKPESVLESKIRTLLGEPSA